MSTATRPFVIPDHVLNFICVFIPIQKSTGVQSNFSRQLVFQINGNLCFDVTTTLQYTALHTHTHTRKHTRKITRAIWKHIQSLTHTKSHYTHCIFACNYNKKCQWTLNRLPQQIRKLAISQSGKYTFYLCFDELGVLNNDDPLLNTQAYRVGAHRFQSSCTQFFVLTQLVPTNIPLTAKVPLTSRNTLDDSRRLSLRDTETRASRLCLGGSQQSSGPSLATIVATTWLYPPSVITSVHQLASRLMINSENIPRCLE